MKGGALERWCETSDLVVSWSSTLPKRDRPFQGGGASVVAAGTQGELLGRLEVSLQLPRREEQGPYLTP